MQLSADDVAEFQRLHKEVFGTEISRENALDQGIKLVQLLSATYQPMTQQEDDEIQAHRKKTRITIAKHITNL